MAQQRYRFVKEYRSGRGAWDPGQIVTIEPEEADWFNRDVPGCLEPAPDEVDPDAYDKLQKELKDAKAEIRTLEHPPQDRQLKAADKREEKVVDKNVGAMSHADFKATKSGD
jgi:hypothetical protein